MRFSSISFLFLALLLSLHCSNNVLCQQEESEHELACDENDHVCLANANPPVDINEIKEDETTSITAVETAVPNAPKGANADGKPREAVKECIDRYPNECPAYVAQGECEKNPGWMIISCAKSCDACHLRDPAIRCDRNRLNMTNAPIYAPGDMNSMFTSIVERFQDRYEINVISTSPWIVTFDNFVSEQEAHSLLNSVAKFERSTDTGSMNEFGESGRILSQSRTSTNAWCQRECEENEDVKTLMGKIEEVTYVPRQNYESFQVLSYEQGQYYRTHHDYGAEDVKLACGPRILTFFLYLSDVDEGGETNFPTLNIGELLHTCYSLIIKLFYLLTHLSLIYFHLYYIL